MYKLKRVCIFIIFILVCFSACEAVSNKKKIEEQPKEQLIEINFDEFDNQDSINRLKVTPLTNSDFEELWPDKTKLIWVVEQLAISKINPAILLAFNDRLIELGADFVVQFVGEDTVDVEFYQGLIRWMKESGEPIDLLNTGVGLPGVDFKTFSAAVQDGLLEPLNEYLSSGVGMKLYETFAPTAWGRGTIDGQIYAVDSKLSYTYPIYLFINKELADNHNLVVPNELSYIEQVEELINEIVGIYQENEQFIPIYLGLLDIREMSQYAYLENGIAVGYGDDGVPYAVNPFDLAEIESMLSFLHQYEKQGWLVQNYIILDHIDDAFRSENEEIMERYNRVRRSQEQVARGNYGILVTNVIPEIYYNGVFDLGSIGDDGLPSDVYSYKLLNNYVPPFVNMVDGVASWSKHKEKAFQLLLMLYTDEHLSNLLRFGMEEEQYKILDGELVINEYVERSFGPFAPANHILTHSIGLEPKDKRKEYQELTADLQMSPIVDFTLDESKIAQEIAAIDAIYWRYEGLWRLEFEDVEATLKAANRELAEAQIELVLEEINRQLAEWWQDR